MKEQPNINSRQKELLRTLLFASAPIQLQELAESVKVSIRTVQREMESLKSVLRQYDLLIVKKAGAGLQVEGSAPDKKRLQEALSVTDAVRMYTPEERQQGVIRDLLLSKEPVKLYVFSKKYGVTEATISYDMDRIEEWFADFGVRVVRKPGLGAYLEGTEQQIRMAASNMLHQGITVEEWLELFNSSDNQNPDSVSSNDLKEMIRSRLLELVHVQNIFSVEKALREVITTQTEIKLSDREYVNLVVHLALAVERVKAGEFIQAEKTVSQVFEHLKEYSLAKRISDLLELYLDISIPSVEIGYIAMHLQGASVDPFSPIQVTGGADGLLWLDLAQSFVRAVEQNLGQRLSEDEILMEGLITHLVPTVNRLRLGLQIHNPLLDQIVADYSEVFAACKEAAAYLSRKIGHRVPEAEIGYLTMHIGAALLRLNNSANRFYTAIIACASGIGTSHFLASRIKKEFPNVEIKAVVSISGIRDWFAANDSVDMVISTVALPSLHSDKVIIVSPFLDKRDLQAIRGRMEQISDKRSFDNTTNRQSPGMLAVARYGEALVQILRNIELVEGVLPASDLLVSMLHTIETSKAICDVEQLIADLKQREQLGGFVLDGLAMVHSKTSGVKELLTVIFRFKQPVPWKGADGQLQPVRTFLLLAAPLTAAKEHLEMISEISAALIEESFVETLCSASYDRLKSAVEDILSVGFYDKTDRILKEPWST